MKEILFEKILYSVCSFIGTYTVLKALEVDEINVFILLGFVIIIAIVDSIFFTNWKRYDKKI